MTDNANLIHLKKIKATSISFTMYALYFVSLREVERFLFFTLHFTICWLCSPHMDEINSKTEKWQSLCLEKTYLFTGSRWNEFCVLLNNEKTKPYRRAGMQNTNPSESYHTIFCIADESLSFCEVRKCITLSEMLILACLNCSKSNAAAVSLENQ